MKAIISSTLDDKYLFFIPLCVWAWNKIGVDVICFLPKNNFNDLQTRKYLTAIDCLHSINAKFDIHTFSAPEHKEATYAQCSRLYAACLDLPEDEVLITSDVDMAVFGDYFDKYCNDGSGLSKMIQIHGTDLVPDNQYPMCYIKADVGQWRNIMDIHNKTYQQCLDDLLGDIEAEHFRGNFWAKDQETIFNAFKERNIIRGHIKRAKEGTQFASKRYDRDDAFLLDRLSQDTIDYHMPRPGYEEKNFEQIMTVLKYHYPNEDMQWLVDYKNEYCLLLMSEELEKEKFKILRNDTK